MSDAGVKIDELHPHVKALTDAGIGIDRLTELVNGSKTPINHESITQQQAANALAAAQQAQQPQIGYIPPLDTAGFQQASELAPMFQQMLASILTPPVPTEPNFANMTPPTGQNNG
jgi:hypothetical protein